MNFLDLATTRYTTKKYNPELKISEEKIRELEEILIKSPSSINSQPWKFVIVSDEQTKNKLAEVSYFNEGAIKGASHLVVFHVIDDITMFEKQIQESLPAGYVEYYNQNLKTQPEGVIKSWLANQVYISLGFFLSACVSMGIDSTPMEGIDSKEYAGILNQTGYKPLFAVALGYRDQQDANQPGITPKMRLSKEKLIHSIN